MKKKILLLFFSVNVFSQVGINTENPTNTLDVNGTMRVRKIDSKTNSKNVLAPDNNGVIQQISVEKFKENQDAAVIGTTRYTGGTVYTYFSKNQNFTNSIFPQDLLITNIGQRYALNRTLEALGKSETARIGALHSILGDGYKISSPTPGIYDIKFDTPFTQIYGVSVNLVDSYGTGDASASNGIPKTSSPSRTLNMNDNTHIAYISEQGIRIKTGDSNGNSSDRSFTFVVTGR